VSSYKLPKTSGLEGNISLWARELAASNRAESVMRLDRFWRLDWSPSFCDDLREREVELCVACTVKMDEVRHQMVPNG
jgi:hypothetical protein